MKFQRMHVIAAIVGGVAIGAVAPALASDPSGFVPTNIVTADLNTVRLNSDGVKFQTKAPTDVRVQRVDVAAGGSSGWHHHPGMVIVAVASGVVTVWESDCSSTTYGPGQPNGSVFVESGDDPGQVTSTGGATVYATYVVPDATPPVFRVEDPAITCP